MNKLILLIVPFLLFATCGENARVDETKNRALENICNGETALRFLEKGTSIGREYVCLCQQAAKKSDQDLCRKTIDLNNGKELITTCKMLFPENIRTCREMFNAVK